MGRNGHCPDCRGKLTSVKLYAPEILRIFDGGHKDYSKQGILVNYAVCLSAHCPTGNKNLNSYDRVVSDGLIKE